MKRKKYNRFSICFLLIFILLFSVAQVKAESIPVTEDWTRYQNTETNNGVTDRPGPTDAAHAVSLWESNLDIGASAKTPPLIIGDKLYIACYKNVYCLDKKTGKQLKVSDSLTGEVGFGLHPMVYANGTLYVLTGGSSKVRVEAFQADSLKKLWSSEGVSGTTYSPLAYHEINGTGYLYSGTFQGAGRSGYYFCIAAQGSDAGKIIWQKDYSYGFYWDGAYVTDKYMVFASENSESEFGTKEDSSLYVVDPLTGEEIDRIDKLHGNIRNTVSYDNGYIYVATMTGRLYRIKISDNGKLADPEDGTGEFSYIDLEGPIRASTIIHNNRVYAAMGYASNNLNDPSGEYYYAVLDGSQPLTKYSLYYKVPVMGDPTGAPTLSTSEEEKTGKVTLYFTCNRMPGGIYYFTDSAGQTYAEAKELFIPGTGQQEYCISPLALDTDGTIYYKNDSNYVMAVGSKIIQDVKVTTSSGSISGISWDDRFDTGLKNYNLTVNDSVSTLKFEVEKLDAENEEVSCILSVDGNRQESNTVSVNKEKTDVELQITRQAITITYHFTIYKITAQNTSLSTLYYGEDFSSGGNVLPEIQEGKTEYSVDLRENSVTDPYLWILPLHSGASIDVYAVENVKQVGTNQELKAGKILDPIYIEKSGEKKYEVEPVDAKKNTVIRVRITSSDKSKTQDYQVKFIRTDEEDIVIPSTGKVYVTVEKFTIGQGYLIEPCEVTYKAGDTGLQILDKVLKEKGYQYSIKAGTTGYIEGIRKADTGKVKVPSCIKTVWDDIMYTETDKDLFEGDYSTSSGWYYFVNNIAPKDTLDEYKVKDGDVIRLCFTLYGYGGDVGNPSGTYLMRPNFSSLTKLMALFNANKSLCVEKKYQPAYNEAVKFASDMDAHVVASDGSNREQIEAKVKNLCAKLPTQTMINKWKAEKAEQEKIAAAKAEEARRKKLYTPAAPKISTVKSPKKRTVTITWKKNKKATGYEIYMSTKKASGYKKIATIKKWNKEKYTYKNSKLKKNKKYYFKIRAYKTAYKKNYYSSYSKVKYVKVK